MEKLKMEVVLPVKDVRTHLRVRPNQGGPVGPPPPNPVSRSAGRSWLQSFRLDHFILPIAVFVLTLVFWEMVSQTVAPGIPGPIRTVSKSWDLIRDPFFNRGPNNKGLGWQLLYSLGRVAIGFALATAVGIPIGFLLGASPAFYRAVNPLIQILRPISPLAWLPIGLTAFKAAGPAAFFVIFITSIWPIILNTAFGVQKISPDYLSIARVLRLSAWKRFHKILLPATLPYTFTGLRISVGIAWLVIVAAEMLTGGVGIGFFIWDEWNNLNLEHIILAIFVIGIVGLILDGGMALLGRRFDYEVR
ncbi:MAG: nitrate ABC transporter permease [Candidatus Manganitrophaceae bacterium]